MRLLNSLALVALSLAPAAHAAQAPAVSWGKAGVSFDQYRQDAVTCGRAGYYLDVAETDAAKTFRSASQRLENNEAGWNVGTRSYLDVAITTEQIIQGVRPEKLFRDVRALQQQAVAACLTERGYKRFTLTSAQTDYLRHLKKGAPERHQYLFSLAASPQVLEAQGIAG